MLAHCMSPCNVGLYQWCINKHSLPWQCNVILLVRLIVHTLYKYSSFAYMVLAGIGLYLSYRLWWVRLSIWTFYLSPPSSYPFIYIKCCCREKFWRQQCDFILLRLVMGNCPLGWFCHVSHYASFSRKTLSTLTHK